jgi:hypothetical protein
MTEQEPDPPDMLLVALASLRLLRDVHDRLSDPGGDPRDVDLRGRVAAMRDVFVRMAARLEEQRR